MLNSWVPDVRNWVTEEWHLVGLGRLNRSRDWWTVFRDVEHKVPEGHLGRRSKQKSRSGEQRFGGYQLRQK